MLLNVGDNTNVPSRLANKSVEINTKLPYTVVSDMSKEFSPFSQNKNS